MKQLQPTLLLLLLVLTSYSPSFGQHFFKTYGDFGTVERLNTIIPTDDDGLLAVGTTDKLGSDNVYLMKTNALGELEWLRLYGSTADEAGMDVVQDADGDFMVVGTSNNTSSGKDDIFVFRVNSSGNMLWSKLIGHTDSYEEGVAITKNANGYFSVLGSSNITNDKGMVAFAIDAAGVVSYIGYYNKEQTDLIPKGIEAAGIDASLIAYDIITSTYHNIGIAKIHRQGPTVHFSKRYVHSHDQSVNYIKENGFGEIVFGGTSSTNINSGSTPAKAISYKASATGEEIYTSSFDFGNGFRASFTDVYIRYNDYPVLIGSRTDAAQFQPAPTIPIMMGLTEDGQPDWSFSVSNQTNPRSIAARSSYSFVAGGTGQPSTFAGINAHVFSFGTNNQAWCEHNLETLDYFVQSEIIDVEAFNLTANNFTTASVDNFIASSNANTFFINDLACLPPNGTCTDPIVIDCVNDPQYNGTTISRTNDFSSADYSSCFSTSRPFDGADQVHMFYTDGTGKVFIVLNNKKLDEGGADLDLFLFDDLCGAGAPSCIDRSFNSGTTDEVIGPLDLPAGNYYLVVDGATPEFQGNYTLKVGCCDCDENEQPLCAGYGSSVTYPGECYLWCLDDWGEIFDYQVCGNQCEPIYLPIDVYCNDAYTGTTQGADNSYDREDYTNTNCGTVSSLYNGPDIVHLFHLEEAGDVTFRLTNLTDDLELFVFSEFCDGPAYCLERSYNSGTEDEIIHLDDLPIGAYYVIVDGATSDAVGNYTLRIDCDCVCPTIFDPVCGSDGITYSNSCLAECAGIYDYEIGPCSTADAVIFEVGSATVVSGSTVNIPINVQNFNNISGFQFSLHSSDPQVASIVGGDAYNLPGLNAQDFNFIDASTASCTWFAANPQSLEDGTTIFELQIQVAGTPGSVAVLTIDNSPTNFAVFDGDINLATSISLSGIVTVQSTVDVGGQVYTTENEAVPDVLIQLSGATSEEDITDASGNYLFSDLSPGSDYTVTPYKDEYPLNGVDVGDILTIQRYINANYSYLNTPYKIIAADVNNDGQILVNDLIILQRLINTSLSVFPNNESWRFVPEEYVFTDPSNPLNEDFPEAIFYSPLEDDKVAEDFIAIKTGDVNSTVMPIIASGERARVDSLLPVVFYVEHLLAYTGQEVTLAVKVNNFVEIAGFQISLNWDADLLQFLSIADTELAGLTENDFSVDHVSDGQLSLVWFTDESETLADGDLLFSLSFTVAGAPDSTVELAFSDTPTPIAVFNEAIEAVGFELVSGQVSIHPYNDLIVGAEVSTPSCHDETDGSIELSVSGGWGTYSFIWSTGATTPNLQDVPAGTYSCTISDSEQTAVETGDLIVSQPMPIVVEVSTTPENGNHTDGTASAAVTGGIPPYTYLWDDAMAQTTAVATNLSIGSYQVSVTDSNGCQAVATANVSTANSTRDPSFSRYISLYPNPAKQVMYCEYALPEMNDLSITIYNQLGQRLATVQRMNTKKGVFDIDLGSWSAGLYYLQFSTVENTVLKSFVIAK
jgi:hypothetical protein